VQRENSLYPLSKSSHSIYFRCKDALYPIKRLYVIDAINALLASHRKPAKLMVRTLWNLLDHAKARNYDPMRLWVHGCLIGKTKRYFNVRYHAKGKGSR
jgi:ribosomal protein L22